MVYLVPCAKPLIVLLSLAILAAVAVPVAAEGPTRYACDTTLAGKGVCTGVEGSGSVTCDATLAAVASCDVAGGWVADAWSPIGLNGRSLSNVSWEIQVCSSVSGCYVPDGARGGENTSCAWTGPVHCGSGGGFEFTVPDTPLALGECLTVTVTLVGGSTAWAPAGPLPPLAAAFHDDGDSAAGQVCHVDDGRGA